jgi:protein-S-isoprenylcysteine O-methyltransferase Ste14
LPLVEQLTASGGRLFRRRSYLPLVFLLPELYVMATVPPGLPSSRALLDFVCLGIGLVGLGVRVWTVGHVPSGTSGRSTRGQRADTLNTSGPYSVVRHPLYVGNFLMGLGVACFPGIWWVAVIYVLAFWLYYERIVLAEEDYLRRAFGDVFLEWAERTPVFVPDLRKYRPAALPFSWRNVVGREYNGVLALVVVMTLLDVAGVLRSEQRLGVHSHWVYALAAAALAWVVAYTVKRATRWLDVTRGPTG